MAPKPQNMTTGEKVFYWADTGPVECRVEDGFIVQALMVETIGEEQEAWAAQDR